MTTIYKYHVNSWPEHITLPRGATFLTVQAQHNMPVAWFEVDPTAPPEQRLFVALTAGEPIHMPPNKRKYLGTFQLNAGTLVFHLFELLS